MSRCRKRCDECKFYLRMIFEDNESFVVQIRDNDYVRRKKGIPLISVGYSTCFEYQRNKNQLNLNLGG